ncbi:hypothetical protein V8F20_010580 [Naviculisporaceae sp. PSN 640]
MSNIKSTCTALVALIACSLFTSPLLRANNPALIYPRCLIHITKMDLRFPRSVSTLLTFAFLHAIHQYRLTPGLCSSHAQVW